MTGTVLARYRVTVPVVDGMLWFDGSDQVAEPVPEPVLARLDGREITYFGYLTLARLPSTGTEVELEVEIRDGEPEPDLDDWQHVLALYPKLPGGLLHLGTVGGAAAARIPVPDPSEHGWHAALLSGAVLDSRLWADPEVPESRWRLQLWPTQSSTDPHPVKTWVQPPPEAALPGRASGGSLVSRQVVEAWMDYHTILLMAGPSPAEEDYSPLLLTAQEDGGAGCDGRVAVVISPLQWNPALPVEVEVWDGEPPYDLDDWEEGFELCLEVTRGQVVIGQPVGRMTPVPVPDGDYAARFYGRGFHEDGWEAPDTPGDSWRLQLWPAPADRRRDRATRVKSWVYRPGTPEPEPEPEAVEQAGPDLFQARAQMSARMGHHGVPDHVIELLKPGVVWPGHPDYQGPG